MPEGFSDRVFLAATGEVVSFRQIIEPLATLAEPVIFFLSFF
jgi:hypothetical protein